MADTGKFQRRGLPVCLAAASFAGCRDIGAWSEHTNPDGLSWGTYDGFETLFWLDSGRTSGKHIFAVAQKRLFKAIHYAEAMKIRTIFAFLGPAWTIESARPAFVPI